MSACLPAHQHACRCFRRWATLQCLAALIVMMPACCRSWLCRKVTADLTEVGKVTLRNSVMLNNGLSVKLWEQEIASASPTTPAGGLLSSLLCLGPHWAGRAEVGGQERRV